MKKAILLGLLVMLALGLMVGVALATDPGISPATEGKPHTFIESDPEAGSGIATGDAIGRARPELGYGGFGSSLWSYQDASDASFKTEGSYAGFDSALSSGIGGYSTAANPHGSYATTSNKCKVCHAVHRAEGAFKLMRADAAEDACTYCHVGDHRHTEKGAYDGAGGDIHASNGHTIGSGKEIPDSSTWQWLEAKTMTGGDPAENGGAGYTATINIRRYNTNRNKLMGWTWERSSHHQGERRWGPTLLTCMSCHQPHNATELVWKPTGSASGYKLLRGSPSGSIKNKVAMEGYSGFVSRSMVIDEDVEGGDTTVVVVRSTQGGGPANYLNRELKIGVPFSPLFGAAQPAAPQLRKVTAVADNSPVAGLATLTLDSALSGVGLLYYGEAGTAPDHDYLAVVETAERVTVPEATLGAATTGKDSNWVADPVTGRSPAGYFRTVYTAWKGSNVSLSANTLSSWCADCHNLNIASPEVVGSNFRGGKDSQMHSDRSHTAGNTRTECYVCHRSDLPSPAVNEFDYEFDFKVVLSQGSYDVVNPGSSGACDFKCHLSATRYGQIKGISDFPHSGDASSTKLLKDRVGAYDPTGVTPLNVDGVAAYDASSEHIDAICLDCHNLMGNKM